MSNHLRAFVRYNNNGKVVPSGMVFAAHPPKTGKWKEIPITFCCSTIPFPTVSSNNKELKAYVRYDGQNKLVPGGPILSRSKPKVGNWVEINDNLCCETTTTIKCFGPYYINTLESPDEPYLNVPGTSCMDNECNTIIGYSSRTNVPDPPGDIRIFSNIIIKYDSAGNTLWQKVLTIEGGFLNPFWQDAVGSIAVDSNNDIYVSTILSLFKLSGNDGSLVWMKYFTSAPFPVDDQMYPTSLCVTKNDEVFYLFSYPTPDTFSNSCNDSNYIDTTIVKLNPNTGDSILEKTIRHNSTSFGYDITYTKRAYSPIISDNLGNIIIDMPLSFCTLSYPEFTFPVHIKLNNNLNFISNSTYDLNFYEANYFGVLSPTAESYITVIDKNNNIYFSHYGFGDPRSTVVTKVLANNSLGWFKRIDYSVPGVYFDFSTCAVDSDGNMYILATNYDEFGVLIKLDTNGNLVWATSIVDSTGDFYDEWWWNMPNQMTITKDVITIIGGPYIPDTSDAVGRFIKIPTDTQTLGTYGTITFADVTSDFTVTNLSIPILTNNIPNVTVTNFYPTLLKPYTLTEPTVANYTVSTINI